MHINWLKNQICVLVCMLRSHARNGNEFETPGHRWLLVKHWDAWFLNSSKSKTRLKFHETWHAIMERHRHAVVQILSHLGQVWVYSSHKPELLTTSMMVLGRERPTFVDATIYAVPLEFIYKGNIELHECPVKFWNPASFGLIYTFIEFLVI